MPLSQAKVKLCSFKHTILARHKKATSCAFESIIDRMIQNKHCSETKQYPLTSLVLTSSKWVLILKSNIIISQILNILPCHM